MSQLDDCSGDDWMRPSSSQDTQRFQIDRARVTRGNSQRPQLEKSPWKPGEIVAGFELVRVIGCGSHGWVFEAHDTATDQTVAMKLIPSIDPKDAVRSKTGFRRMVKLRHSGLVRLHRILHAGEALAFSMELIDGENLVPVLRRWKKLSLQESCERLLEMLRQIGAGLAWLHAHQLVHRDIKPTNLMMTADGNRFVIVDCDLAGVFEAESDPQNIRSYLIWTPMYVAPEVLFRQSYCPASDIFSLGMVALEALRMFSSAQRRRDHESNDDGHTPRVESVTSESEEGEIPRDNQSSQCDSEYILKATVGLHKDIPESLLEILHEMLSPEVSNRPTAMAVARAGRTSIAPISMSTQSQASARADRTTRMARAQQLIEFRQWSHLILAGQVKRLHIEGASGIGKSTFLQLAIDELRSQSWPLVFVARCQRFEQIPLQAFSQIADEIVIRYRRGGFDKIKVDSVSESILQRVLPGLGEVLEVDWSQPPIVTSENRPGGLDAALKVCSQLREIGPLFFVIDDVQWADQDTLRTLDHFQSSASNRLSPPMHQGFGLITVSRSGGDRQEFPPDANITLGPLTTESTSHAIRSEAKLHGMILSEAQLRSLNDQIEGQPYRLEAYLSEMGPEGMLHRCLLGKSALNGSEYRSGASPEQNAPPIEDVWQHRTDQLTPGVARLLDVIAVSGRQITFDHLSAIESNASLLESQLDKLVDNRLIVRDGSDGQYIRIWHDLLARKLRSAIPPEQRQQLHRQWAECLVRVPLSAGRIAEHYEQAGDSTAFVNWANQAAVQAQQIYAHLESARWHRSVAEHSTGAERVSALRSAAESLQRSGRLLEAAHVYEELSELLTGQAKLDAELERIECYIRAGRFIEAVEHLDPLLSRLKLPRRKSQLSTKLFIAWHRSQQVTGPTELKLSSDHTPPRRSELQTNQIAFCRALVRPLSMLDNRLATELSIFNYGIVKECGSRLEQIELTAGICVFNSYQPGPKRIAAERLLVNLSEQLTDDDSPGCHGEVCSGRAWSASMSGRYSESIQHIEKARKFYASSELNHGFELAHSRYLESVCYFQMGNLTAMAAMVDDMQVEGSTTNDCFVLAMGSLGYSSAAFLMRDDLSGLDTLHADLFPNLQKLGEDAFAMAVLVECLLRVIYLSDPGETAITIAKVDRVFRRSMFRRNQLLRMLITELTAVATIALLAQSTLERQNQFRDLITSLRRERLDAADVKADLIEGLAMTRYPEMFSNDRESVRSQAKLQLERAAASADVQQLVPSAFAARDELARLEGQQVPEGLDAFLREQGVVNVSAFARLYRGSRE